MDAMLNSVQRNNEVVGLETKASAAPQSLIGRVSGAVSSGVKNFFSDVKSPWHLTPMRERPEVLALHAA